MFITKQDLFKDHTDAVVVTVFSDHIGAFGIHKKEGTAEVWGMAEEAQEEAAWADRYIDPGAVVLNIYKAVAAFLRGVNGRKPTHIFFILGDGAATTRFARVHAARDDAERKITREEADALVGRPYGHEGAADAVRFRNFPQHFFVDGFAVDDPFGMRGTEITVNLLSVTAPAVFLDALKEMAQGLGMVYGGCLDIASVVAERIQAKSSARDYLSCCVFCHETVLLLVRGGTVAGMDVIPSGYDILYAALAKTHGIGKEEARHITGKASGGTLRPDVTATLERMLGEQAPAFARVVREGYLRLDKENLLPGSFFIGVPACAAGFSQALLDEGQFADFPVERGGTIQDLEVIFPETPGSGSFLFDRIVIDHCIS